MTPDTHKTPDPRYTVNLEACGQPMPQFVARFCGQWIGWRETREQAVALCHEIHTNRLEEFL